MFPITNIVANSGLRQLLLSNPVILFTNIQFRQINFDKLSNKRITRLESDIELNNCEYKNRVINRNPRNLEQLSFETKPAGFWLDKSPPSSWNKLIFEQSGRYLNAYLLHWSGRKLIEASTREPQLFKYFKSPSTTQAATILAQVISRRCLQSGYLYAGVDDHGGDEKVGLKTKIFFDSIESNGIMLNEPSEIIPRSITDL